MRWFVHDTKYEDSPFLVDLKDDETQEPKCSCKEFHFQVVVKKRVFRDRSACGHITFLVDYLLRKAGHEPIHDI